MKYVILVGDGMADIPLTELEGKTPLSAANKPGMDFIASKGINGRVYTVPDGMVPESDTANLSIMGYDPLLYSKGRSPLEAASIGIQMFPEDTVIRANIVTLSEEETAYEDKHMVDHSSGEITTQEADELIKAVQEVFGDGQKTFYTGVSYRHCLIWKDCPDYTDFTRPHDIIGQCIGDHRPRNASSQAMWELQKASFDLLNNHPINLARAAAGKRGARLIGYRGTVEFDFYTGVVTVYQHLRNITETHTFNANGSAHFGGDRRLAENFVGVMQGTERSNAPLSEGIRSAALCLGAKKSSIEHVFVEL
jgi:2,3-bisphosphoglycerate-independent phosphoglycerate mutase